MQPDAQGQTSTLALALLGLSLYFGQLTVWSFRRDGYYPTRPRSVVKEES
jgi:hypothetical protein